MLQGRKQYDESNCQEEIIEAEKAFQVKYFFILVDMAITSLADIDLKHSWCLKIYSAFIELGHPVCIWPKDIVRSVWLLLLLKYIYYTLPWFNLENKCSITVLAADVFIRARTYGGESKTYKTVVCSLEQRASWLIGLRLAWSVG